MLTDSIKTSTLWKKDKGWGSTHERRELFEELYRSFKNISTGSVLTYGDLLPRKSDDKYADAVKALTAGNNIWEYEESSYKTIPIIKLVTVKLTPISDHCNDAYAILDENGNQYKNIIPFDFSEEGFYNYTLRNTATNAEIFFGVNDWMVDTDASILTFNNGIPDGVNASNPPTLTFYQYVGPVGERIYIDAALYDVNSVPFVSGNPVTKFTNELRTRLDDVWSGWFDKHGFNGDDNTEGVGLGFNLLTPVANTETGDAIKGWDDNSNAQVVSLLTHKVGRCEKESVKILFASEGLSEPTYQVQVTEAGISKIDFDDGFFIVESEIEGTFETVVEDSEDIFAVLLVKDNETQEFELYIPRSDEDLTVKVPVFIDLKVLPPHLKLNSLASYSDEIIPQYYGPRVADFVIASYEDTVSLRSADFIVYNKAGAFLQDAINAKTENAHHIVLRNGTYLNGDVSSNLEISDLHIEGESRLNTVIKNAIIYITESGILSDVTLKDCRVIVQGEDTSAVLKNVTIDNVTIEEGICQIFDSTIGGELSLKKDAECQLYNSYVDLYDCKGSTYIYSSHIGTLAAADAELGSIIDSTSIDFVESISKDVKLDSSYVTQFGEEVDYKIYPRTNTVPFYTAFNNRVYAQLPDPFEYREVVNEDGSKVAEIRLKLDTDYHTIKLNDKGELFTRFFTTKEIAIDSVDDIKTQAEEKGYGHADTVLETERPKNVDEAILDLYWSKADLIKGKIPIDQLPDSVAYGGLSLVGMWSFEDHDGEFPTFEDADTTDLSDDEYTGLQKGWFFIVSASHAKDESGENDDPCFPQKSVDGEIWTAGDWIIYTGKGLKKVSIGSHTETIEKEREIEVEVKFSDIDSQEKAEEAIAAYVEDHADLGLTKFEGELTDVLESMIYDSYKGAYNYSTLYTDGEHRWIAFINTGDISALGFMSIPDMQGFNQTASGAVLSGADTVIYTYTDKVVENEDVEVEDFKEVEYDVFEKLDRAYSDPVYSRLPEYAPNTEGKNVKWDVDSDGTGVLNLSFKSLAEAIRLINEQLYKQYPDRPASILTMSIVVDEKNTTADAIEFVELNQVGDLNQYMDKFDELKKVAFDSESGFVAMKQVGVHDELPLEHEFYCGNYSDFVIYDRDRDNGLVPLYQHIDNVTGLGEVVSVPNMVVDCKKADPYAKYRLGFKAPTVYKSIECSALLPLNVEMGEPYWKDHSITYAIENLSENKWVKDTAAVSGHSKALKFQERLFYDLSDIEIKPCSVNSINTDLLNAAMSERVIAGIPFLAKPYTFTGRFLVENFARYGAVTRDAGVDLRASFGELEPIVEILEQKLQIDDDVNGNAILSVQFSCTIEPSVLGQHDLKVYATCHNNGFTSREVKVLEIDAINCLPEMPNIVNHPQAENPTLGVKTTPVSFAPEYDESKPYTWSAELALTDKGFGWPVEQYVEKFTDYKTPVYVDLTQTGLNTPLGLYRFVTYKFSEEKIRDLVGFNLNIEYGDENVPVINRSSGAFNDVRIGVLVTSVEDPHEIFLNGNACVKPFFQADFTKSTEGLLYPGKSNVNTRRITFGRKPVPVKDIYVRIGLPAGSNVYIKNVDIDTNIDC